MTSFVKIHVSGGRDTTINLDHIESVSKPSHCNEDERLIRMVSGDNFLVHVKVANDIINGVIPQ